MAPLQRRLRNGERRLLPPRGVSASGRMARTRARCQTALSNRAMDLIWELFFSPPLWFSPKVSAGFNSCRYLCAALWAVQSSHPLSSLTLGIRFCLAVKNVLKTPCLETLVYHSSNSSRGISGNGHLEHVGRWIKWCIIPQTL